MSAAFAAAELRLGRVAGARLCNATASFNGGDAVSGIFNNAPRIAGLGQVGVQARQPQFACPLADALLVTEGTTLTVTHPGATAPYYTVRQRLPDDLHAGWSVFQLEPAAA